MLAIDMAIQWGSYPQFKFIMETKLMVDKSVKIQTANGIQGFLIWTMHGDYKFRVYDDDGEFTDYSILHCDLQITINDEDAYFYEHEDGSVYLDHSPQTLGIDDAS